MILFRPLIRYADFKGRASRSEYWLFAVLQGFWYFLLIGLATLTMGQDDHQKASAGLLIALGLIGISIVALIVPNYAVPVRRLHDSGRGAIWLLLMAPSVLSALMTIGTILTAVAAVGAGASRDAFLTTALAGLGAAGLLGVVGWLGQLILTVLTLLPGTKGENAFGHDPRDPGHYAGTSTTSTLDEARLDALFAEAKRANAEAQQSHRPSSDFGRGPATQQPGGWNAQPYGNGITPAPTFGRRGL